MPNIKVQRHYRPDLYLFIVHALLLASSFTLIKFYPHVIQKPDMSGIFFMLISILGGIIAIVILAVCLSRLDRSVRALTINKFILALIYWISSTSIFIMAGYSEFLFNNPLCILVFAGIFYPSLYFSIIKIADMRRKDWLIMGGILGSLVLLFFLPKL
ncbi:hypothetical protein [Acinetobacter pragensis]|uniref:hypothetical protein n=1 Tax=Acinetobacter pragensis TaxID=1806892 RepID=UPI003341D00D